MNLFTRSFVYALICAFIYAFMFSTGFDGLTGLFESCAAKGHANHCRPMP